MITYVMGDLFQSPAKVLVNPVNTIGVMGKGIASDFKRFYPEMFEQYRALCEAGRLAVGQLHLYKTAHKWILNFPTKRHWRDALKLEDVEVGLQKFAATYAEQGITSVSFPALGVGEGKLDWQKEARPLMEAYLDPLPIAVYIHLYDETTSTRNTRAIASWLSNTPQTVGFDKVWRDLVRLVKRKSEFMTDDETPFSVNQDGKTRARNLIVTKEGQTTFLSESMLADLWTYVRGAGYCLPDNLPGGLDLCSDCLIALLCELEYVRPVVLGTGSDNAYSGLHYIPPAQKESPRIVVLDHRSDV